MQVTTLQHKKRLDLPALFNPGMSMLVQKRRLYWESKLRNAWGQ